MGYQWGSFDYYADANGGDVITITISNSSACSEDNFQPHCHVIRPEAKRGIAGGTASRGDRL